MQAGQRTSLYSLGFSVNEQIDHLLPEKWRQNEFVYLSSDCSCRELSIDKFDYTQNFLDLDCAQKAKKWVYQMGQFDDSGVSPYPFLSSALRNLDRVDGEKTQSKGQTKLKRGADAGTAKYADDDESVESWLLSSNSSSSSSRSSSGGSSENIQSRQQGGKSIDNDRVAPPEAVGGSGGELAAKQKGGSTSAIQTTTFSTMAVSAEESSDDSDNMASISNSTAKDASIGTVSSMRKNKIKKIKETKLTMKCLNELNTAKAFSIIWHRCTELPLDVSVGQFKLECPVESLVDGGYLLRVNCNPAIIGERLIVKIVPLTDIRKINEQINKGFRAHAYMYDELLVLRKLSHPNVAKLLYYFENDGNYFSIFPPYQSAIKLMETQKKKKISISIKMIRCIAKAVEYLYRNYIVHRDIALNNIMIGNNNEPVLFNFHYATFHGTKVAKLMPTFLPECYHRAPEVVSRDELMRGNFFYYHNCDIWGLGVLLGELLLSQKAMQTTLHTKLDMNWIFSVQLQLMKNKLTKEVFRILRQCLKKRPEDRPDIYQLIRQLLSIELQ